jgi:hypothetical protein
MDKYLMLKLFLDTLMRFALENPNSLTPYTQQMADEMDELLAGVTVDEGAHLRDVGVPLFGVLASGK